MSVKGIIIKIVLGLLAVGILVGSIYQLLKPSEGKTGNNIEVYSADWTAVKSVEIKGSEEYTLLKDRDGWVMEGIEGVKVNQTFADTLVKSLCNIESPMKVDSFGVDLSDYGLEEPLVNAKLDFGGKEKSIFIGNESGEYYYLKVEGDNDIYIVSAPDLYMVFLERIKYLDDTVLSMYADSVTSLSYNDVVLEKGDDGWMQKAPYEAVADNDKVKEILESLSDISALEIVTRRDVDTDVSAMVSVILDSSNAITFDVCGNYIVFEHAEYAYKVSDSELAFLNVTGFDLIQKYVAPIAISDVKSVKFTSNEGVIDFTIEAPESEAPVFYKNGAEIPDASFRSFYQSLMGLMFTKEGSVEGMVEYSITFTKTDESTYTVQFLPISESEYAVDVNGSKGFVINKKSVTDIFDMAKNVK